MEPITKYLFKFLLCIPLSVMSWFLTVEPTPSKIQTSAAIDEVKLKHDLRPTTTTTTQPPTTTTTVDVVEEIHKINVQIARDRAWVLACLNRNEGSPAYDQHDGDPYSGRYQFKQSTFDYAVKGAGHGKYVGVPAWKAPPKVQDDAAWWLYQTDGVSHWPPSVGKC